MTIQEKISLAAQPNKVYFFKEGMFYKLYNQNAMWFVNHIKAYKVSVKFVKTVNQNVFSIGFPQTVLNNNTIALNLKQLQKATSYVCYQTNYVVSNQHYTSWCNATNTQQISMQSKVTATQNITQQLKNFDVANNTPMQALALVVQLKALL